MSNAGDWYNNTVPLYYSFEDAANHKITVRNRSEVTYSETTPGDPSMGQIEFDKKCQWDMVGTVTMTYVEGRPADFNFVNSYSEDGVPLDIVKLDATDMATPLEKAQFRLRKVDPEGRGSYLTGDAAFTKDSGETDSEGKTAIEGIRTGYYEVSEIKVPDDYVQIEDSRLYIRVSDGVIRRIIVTENDPETTDIDESLVKNWTVVGDNDDGTLRFHAAKAAAADNPATTDVNEAAPAANATFTLGNTPGAALPAAGGPGTRLYILLGGALIAIAGALLVHRCRIS